MSELVMPGFDRIAEFRKGRNIRAGYKRGWGLQFGDLQQQLLDDKLYQAASKLATGRSVVAPLNRMNIYLILKMGLQGLDRGHIVEFGAYRGGNAMFMAKICQELHPQINVYAFDTFEGMPDTDPDRDAHSAGDFNDVAYDELQEMIHHHGLTNLKLVKGLFEDTAEEVLQDIGQVALNHIDCDIYSAVAYSYEVTKPYMVPGGYWVLDDAIYSSCIGATEAVEELFIMRDRRHSEQIFPHYVFRNL
jgi:hypothetical protein